MLNSTRGVLFPTTTKPAGSIASNQHVTSWVTKAQPVDAERLWDILRGLADHILAPD